MNNTVPEFRFSATFGLLFIFLAYFLFIPLSALYSTDVAKQAFIVSLASFLLFALILKVGVAVKASTNGNVALSNSVFTKEEIFIASSLLPYVVICLLRPSPEIAILYAALLFLCISFFSSVEITEPFLSALSALLFLLIVVHGLIYFGQGTPEVFQSVFPQKNSFALNMLAAFFSSALVFSLSNDASTKATCGICIMACIALIFASHSRGTALDILLFTAFWWLWPIISKTKIAYWGAITFVLTCGLLLVPVYVLLSFSALGNELDEVLRHYTGIGLFSGRNLVWPAYLYLISLRPFFGYGFGDTVGSLLRMVGLPPDYLGLSAHNLYLMTASQTGIAGVAALLTFFAIVWGCLYNHRRTTAGTMAGCMFLTMLVNEMFEVSFTQTNLYTILLVWCFVGLGMQRKPQRAVAADVVQERR